MRFEHITIRNLGPFREVDIDLSAIDGKLVAITGDNGEGKSSLLEFLPGALYRDCPTQGTLVKRASARDSMVEVRVVNGKSYTVRQTVDAISGKGEALILDADGVPQLDTGKVRDADAWVAAHFPTAEVLYSSSFLSQASKGFIDLPASQRKSVLLRLLQIERLEGLAERARERARGTKSKLDTARARLEEAKRRTPDLTLTSDAHDAAVSELAAAESDLVLAQQKVTTCEALLAEVERTRELAERRGRLQQQMTDNRHAAGDLSERLANNKMLLQRQVTITAAVKRCAELAAELTAVQLEHHTLGANIRAANAEAGTTWSQCAQTKKALETATRLFEQNAELLEDQAQIESAVKRLPKLQAALKTASADVAKAEQHLSDMETSLRTQKDTRIQGLRGGLTAITKPAAAIATAKKVAQKALDMDDALEIAAKAGPKTLVKLREQLDELRHAQHAAQQDATDTSALARRHKEIARAVKDRVLLHKELVEARQADESAIAASADVAARIQAMAPANRSLTARAQRLRDEHAEFDKLAQLQPKLDAAAARVDEIEPQLERLEAQHALLKSEVDALPPAPTWTVDLPAAQMHVKRALAREQVARSALATQVERLAAAQSGAVQCSAIVTEIEEWSSTHANWTRLGQDLGKDGLQALEIDAAIPALNALTNDLLHACFGSQFTIEVRTDRLSSDGMRVLEDLEVRVLDTLKGRDAPIEEFSGGQKVVLGEALSLALTMLCCQRAGLTRPTLVRDESGAALDVANGRAYITMLRRAAEILDADKVLFVTHTPELQELADARIVVRDGAAVVSAAVQ